MKAFTNGLSTGLTLQLAIGPVFFFIVNLTLQRSFLDGLAGVLAVTVVDYIYISLAILGIGQLLSKPRTKAVLGVISPIALMIFGLVILRQVIAVGVSPESDFSVSGTLSSFGSVFLLTLSSPMTIVFFTSIFSTKALEHRYSKTELWMFGFGTGLATLLFMGLSVGIFAVLGDVIPDVLVKVLNGMVGLLLLCYGSVRLVKSFRTPPNARTSK